MTWSHLRRVILTHNYSQHSVHKIYDCISFGNRVNHFSLAIDFPLHACDVFLPHLLCHRHYHKIFILTRDEPERTNIDVNVSKSNKFAAQNGREEKKKEKITFPTCRQKLFPKNCWGRFWNDGGR